MFFISGESRVFNNGQVFRQHGIATAIHCHCCGYLKQKKTSQRGGKKEGKKVGKKMCEMSQLDKRGIEPRTTPKRYVFSCLNHAKGVLYH